MSKDLNKILTKHIDTINKSAVYPISVRTPYLLEGFLSEVGELLEKLDNLNDPDMKLYKDHKKRSLSYDDSDDYVELTDWVYEDKYNNKDLEKHVVKETGDIMWYYHKIISDEFPVSGVDILYNFYNFVNNPGNFQDFLSIFVFNENDITEDELLYLYKYFTMIRGAEDEFVPSHCISIFGKLNDIVKKNLRDNKPISNFYYLLLSLSMYTILNESYSRIYSKGIKKLSYYTKCIENNIDKIEARVATNTIHGSGDDREEII